MPMEKGKEANKLFDLTCLAGNLEVTVVTKCGIVYQGTIVDDDVRSTWGCKPCGSVVCDCEKKDDKKPSPPHGDVGCESHPKFICLKLKCLPGNICCNNEPFPVSFVTNILGFVNGFPPLFEATDRILINLNDILTIGPSHTCLTLDDLVIDGAGLLAKLAPK